LGDDTNNRLVSTNKSGNLTSSRAYDAAGRVTEQVTYSSPGVVSERRSNTYAP
jgi:YD repeat-containing protein